MRHNFREDLHHTTGISKRQSVAINDFLRMKPNLSLAEALSKPGLALLSHWDGTLIRGRLAEFDGYARSIVFFVWWWRWSLFALSRDGVWTAIRVGVEPGCRRVAKAVEAIVLARLLEWCNAIDRGVSTAGVCRVTRLITRASTARRGRHRLVGMLRSRSWIDAISCIELRLRSHSWVPSSIWEIAVAGPGVIIITIWSIHPILKTLWSE